MEKELGILCAVNRKQKDLLWVTLCWRFFNLTTVYWLTSELQPVKRKKRCVSKNILTRLFFLCIICMYVIHNVLSFEQGCCLMGCSVAWAHYGCICCILVIWRIIRYWKILSKYMDGSSFACDGFLIMPPLWDSINIYQLLFQLHSEKVFRKGKAI